MVGFQQAAIKVEREQEFEELQASISRVFSPGKIEQFFKRLSREGLRGRDWDSVLARSAFERVDEVLAKSGKTARGLYQLLTLSDQAQMRELYLSRIEEVDSRLRTRFQKLYRYY